MADKDIAMAYLPPQPPVTHPGTLCPSAPVPLVQSGLAELLALLGVVLLVMVVVLLIKRPLERVMPPTHPWHDRLLQTLPVVLVALIVTALSRPSTDFSSGLNAILFIVHIVAGGGVANGAYKMLRHVPTPPPGR